MLNTPVDEIIFDGDQVAGVRCGDQTARAPLIICDPSYVDGLGKTNITGKVVRAICIIDHEIAGTKSAASVQIILPQKQLKRNSDMYVTMVSHAHAVCADGLYIVIVSTNVETDDPKTEIAPALELLGEIKEMFLQVSDIHEPTNDPVAENLYITKSYDATSHFETSSKDVLAIYEKITGEKLDLNINPDAGDEDY